MRVPKLVWMLLVLILGYFLFNGGGPVSKGDKKLSFQVLEARWKGTHVEVVIKNAGAEIEPGDLSFSTDKGPCKPESFPTIPSGESPTLRLTCPQGSELLMVEGEGVRTTVRIR